jgi:putative colanic acid biosynthesis acetyltransferase WcaF
LEYNTDSDSIVRTARGGVLNGGPSFTVRNRIARALWFVTWTLLARWTPPQLNFWRIFLLRRFGSKIATTARIYSSAKIWLPANLSVGEFAVIGPNVNCYCLDTIVLEDRVVVSQYSHLISGTHELDSPDFQLTTRPIVIRKNAWIAACSIVGPGVIVEEGAVLGAGGVAFSNLDAWEIYAGNPAKRIRTRKQQ